MPLYNILTCGGWEGGSGYIGSGSCIKARVGLVILFFIIAIIRKWGGEEMGLDYNFWLGLLFGIVPYLLIITFTGSFKIALVAGLLGGVAGGYFGGIMFGGSEGGY